MPGATVLVLGVLRAVLADRAIGLLGVFGTALIVAAIDAGQAIERRRRRARSIPHRAAEIAERATATP